MVFHCWLRRAGCISQDTYLLYINLPFSFTADMQAPWKGTIYMFVQEWLLNPVVAAFPKNWTEVHRRFSSRERLASGSAASKLFAVAPAIHFHQKLEMWRFGGIDRAWKAAISLIAMQRIRQSNAVQLALMQCAITSPHLNFSFDRSTCKVNWQSPVWKTISVKKERATALFSVHPS